MPTVSTDSGRPILATSHEQPKPPAHQSFQPPSLDSACAFAERRPPTAPSDEGTRLSLALSTMTTLLMLPPQSAPVQPVTPQRRHFPGQPSRVIAQEFTDLSSPTAPPTSTNSRTTELTTHSRASPAPLSRKINNADVFRHHYPPFYPHQLPHLRLPRRIYNMTGNSTERRSTLSRRRRSSEGLEHAFASPLTGPRSYAL